MILVTPFAVAMLMVILALGGRGVTAATADTILGDLLYPIRPAAESTRLRLIAKPAAREQLQQKIQQRHQVEIKEAIQAGRETDVRSQAELLAFDESSWVVGGLSVMGGDNNTVIVGQPEIGAPVYVQATITSEGTLLAWMLSVGSITPPYPDPGTTSSPMPSSMPIMMRQPANKHGDQ